MSLDIHGDVKHTDDREAVKGRVDVHDQIMRSDAKDAIKAFERLRATRFLTQLLRR